MRIADVKILHGANYYSHSPVIVITVDLEEYDEVFTSDIPGFSEKLIEYLPSLGEHKCSKGVPGGLIERMQEGTLLTHVMEHIAIELQYIAYMDVGFGKTRSTGDKGIYNVIYSYWVDKAGVVAGEEAMNLIKAILDGRDYNVQQTIDNLLGILDDYRLGPSTTAIVEESERREMTVLRLDDYSLIQIGEGNFQKRLKGTMTSNTSFIGVQISGDKGLTSRILRDAGIPVPKNAVSSRIWAAKEDAVWIGYPVVVKPLDGHHGRGVTIGISNESELDEAFERAKEHSKSIIIEETIRGNDYRLLVVNGKLCAAVRRIPAHVIGDGKNTISRLIEIENRNPRRGYGHEKEMTRLAVSSITQRLLAQAGFSLETVLQKDKKFDLELTANLSTGGSAEDVTDDVHPSNRLLAERTARIVGLDIAGVDILAPEIETSIVQNGGKVIEVNAAPGLRAHLAPSVGKRRNVAAPILDMLFPKGSQHDIPIISVTGTNGKTTTVRLAAYMMKAAGHTVGMTCTDGIYVSGRLMVKGDMSGPHSAGVVLKDPTIDCAVFETARGGMLRDGLGYKNADVGVVLNVKSDHLGIGNIHDIEDLSYLKSLVVELVRPGGFSVLNADDPMCVAMSDRCYENLIYFTMNPENQTVTRHLDKGGTAVVYQNEIITVVTDSSILPVAKAADIPITFAGAAEFNIQNAMAAVAAVHSLGVSMDVIRQGLLSFFPSFGQMPGRVNMIQKNDFWVGIDYAHNPHAYKALTGFIKARGYKRVLLVMSAVGDRRDEDIVAAASIAAGIAYQAFIYEDPVYRRGRDPGAIMSLLDQGLINGGLEERSILKIGKENDAVTSALSEAQAGDFVLVMTAHAKRAMDVVRSYDGENAEIEACPIRPDSIETGRS